MFHWIIFLVVIVCQDIFLIVLIALLVVVFSRTWTSHAWVLKMPRVSNLCGKIKVKCKRIWFWDLFLLVFIPLRNSAHCKFGAWQNSEVAGRTGDYGNWLKYETIFRKFLLKAQSYPAYYITAEWTDWTVPSKGEFATQRHFILLSFL